MKTIASILLTALFVAQANAGDAPTPKTATKDAPFVNSLGMKFVPVEITGGATDGKRVLFSIWDTRVQDYAEFAKAKGITPEKPYFDQGPTHPVVNVSWEDAQAFCAWLSKKEGRAYRLPTDAEWSIAVGVGAEQGSTPAEKGDNGPRGVYPWGGQWPPPSGAGNYGDETAKKVKSAYTYVDGYDDGYAYTSPVGSFAANKNALYDMGGNVWQWCEDWLDARNQGHVLRGAAWLTGVGVSMRSTCRTLDLPSSRHVSYGFRCVLVVSGG